MLTGYQCETVAFMTSGDIICPDCALEQYGAVTLAKIERGLASSVEASPMIRYSLDEYVSESAWEYVAQEHEEGTEAFESAFDELIEAGHPCGNCGQSIT